MFFCYYIFVSAPSVAHIFLRDGQKPVHSDVAGILLIVHAEQIFVEVLVQRRLGRHVIRTSRICVAV